MSPVQPALTLDSILNARLKRFQSSPKTLSVLVMLITAITCAEVKIHAADRLLAGREAAARMEDARNEVANVRSNIFLTLVELDRVRGDRDPRRPQFKVFTNQLARMAGLAKAFGQRAQEMKQKGRAYFADWEVQSAALKDPLAQKRAKKNYSERKASYDAINKSMQTARANFMPFLACLTGIKALLEGEQTPQNLAQARDTFMAANRHCIEIQRALMEIEKEFDTLAASFAKDT